MKEILYPNCSELLADFKIHEPKAILKILKSLGKKYKWHFDPPLGLQILKEMTRIKDDDRPVITLLDIDGNMTKLNYGPNGYDNELSYWLADSGNNHYDKDQYPFFEKALNDYGAEMKCYDGGSPEAFDTWFNRRKK